MKNKEIQYEFCMKQFKPAIIGMLILLILVLGWSIIHCTKHPYGIGATLAAANNLTPSAPPIDVKAKMLHSYWGNCSKCHQVTGVEKPISNVMKGPPISVNDKMLHKYWGNCLLCHEIIDGIPSVKKGLQTGNNTKNGKPAAFKSFTYQPFGLKLQTVNEALMKQFSLPSPNGVIILDLIPNSIASSSGLKAGDVITRVGKSKISSVSSFINQIDSTKPGSKLKINIYRNNKSRNIFIRIPKTIKQTDAPMTQNQIETMAEQMGVPKTQQAVTNALQNQQKQNIGVNGILVANSPPMTQNQIETLAEQLGVPKTQQDVMNALKNQGKTIAGSYYGNIAVASMGSNLESSVAPDFESSPYFIIYDSLNNSYRSVANPNINDLFGNDVQTAQYMVDLGVSNVASGNYSINALNTLHLLRVNVYSGITGSIRDIINAFIAGQLIPENTNYHTNSLYNNQTQGIYQNNQGLNQNNQNINNLNGQIIY